MDLRDAILGADDLPREQVPTPEWADAGVDKVWVRGMSAAERDAYEMSLLITMPDGDRRPNPAIKNVRAGFVARLVINEDGSRVFTEKDTKALGEKSAVTINRLWTAGRKLSGMLTEEEEGNPLMGDQEDTNSSDSPSPSESPTPITSESE